ncbi:nitronate monooxygenase [Tardiphaga sp. 42S5]|uniref:NAD(P)H-dependent flavin oxidoreductase n=1 Tax=Tardiphaga sp. 42S5 TaxID=1404799 RepID=UPI002A5A0366|nr:nitronate monooxygenase [Tardiphaga sp. 42S5]WPO43366.1 nitronate monooxygenase [Tardiphaga sp. 42S5]
MPLTSGDRRVINDPSGKASGARFAKIIRPRLSVPLVAAPMFRVSGPELVIAACKAGVIGSFPTANCRTDDELDGWIARILGALEPDDAPFCPNLIIRRESLQDDLATVIRHGCEMVITSVGPPDAVVGPLHEAGCMVFADVASIRHAKKAIAAGVDGLVLLTAGAGGQTGWVNGFSFVRAVRSFWEGPVVLAGGVSDGQAVFAAEVLGCDLSYMGTKFIATEESMAVDEYKRMLVTSELDDVLLSRAFTGLETNTLVPSIVAAGLDPKDLPTDMTKERADALYGRQATSGVKRWRDVWSAGHSVSGVAAIEPVATLVARTRDEYETARAATRYSLGG